MALPSTINPLHYIVERQYRDNVFIKNKLFKERLAKAKNLYRKDLLAHYGCVNAIEFSRDGEYLISGGDDKRILLWSLAAAMYDKGAPLEMRYTHMSNIFCLAFDSRNEHIFSGGNDDQVLIHEVDSRKLKLIIGHNKPVYGISIHPQNDSILTTAGEDGRILLFDIRASSLHDVDRIIVAEQSNGFHSVMFNPMNPKLVVTANSEEGIALWDTRKPQKQLIHYDAKSGKTSGISASFDSGGKQIIALRRRLPPVLYGTDKENALCQFYHPQYYNSCTMKTCCFAGEDDNYILSGSDDFNLYMWRVPKDDSEWGTSHLVLRGHRSIVNQVRYNQHNHLFASSGVEKMVKLWSTIPMSNWKGSIVKEYSGTTRPIYSHEDYVGLVGTTERISHDYSDHSMVEDAKMMAFFDSLIQREIEGWDSTSDGSWTDGDSDEEQDWAEVATRIYRTDKQSFEEPRKSRPNRITQLIMKKKNKLAKLAHSKSSSYVRRKTNRQIQKEKNSRSRLCHTRNNGCTEKPWVTPNLKRKKCTSPKYFTRQSVRHLTEQIGSPDTPSTSTGITGSKNVLYRIVEQDSDEEQSRVVVEDEEEEEEEEEEEAEPQNNLINILPTPLNGTSDIFINVLEVETAATRNHRNASQPYNCTLGLDEEEKEEEEEEEEEEVEVGNTLAQTGNKEEPEEEAEEEEEEDEDAFSVELSSDSDFEATYATPKRRCLSGASSADSGCATTSSSVKSSATYSSGSSRQSCSKEQESDNDASKFARQLRNIRSNNLKRKISADSDSN